MNMSARAGIDQGLGGSPLRRKGPLLSLPFRIPVPQHQVEARLLLEALRSTLGDLGKSMRSRSRSDRLDRAQGGGRGRELVDGRVNGSAPWGQNTAGAVEYFNFSI